MTTIDHRWKIVGETISDNLFNDDKHIETVIQVLKECFGEEFINREWSFFKYSDMTNTSDTVCDEYEHRLIILNDELASYKHIVEELNDKLKEGESTQTNKLRDEYESRISTLQQRLYESNKYTDMLNTTLITQRQTYNDELSIQKENYEKTISELKTSLSNTLNTELETSNQKLTNELNNTKLQLELSNAKLLNQEAEHNKSIQELKTQIEQLQTVKSSRTLGEIGEDVVINLIKELKPEFVINHVGCSAHLADIRVEDLNNSITYVIEVKNKQTITNEDIVKFKNDITSTPNAYGIFISLRSENIPRYGRFAIDNASTIYLTRDYISKECLNLVFTYFTIIHGLNTVSPEHVVDRVEYIMPENVIRSISAMLTFNSEIQNQLSTLETVETSLNENASKIHISRLHYLCVNNLLQSIIRELNIPSNSNSTEQILEDQRKKLSEYIKINKKNLKVKELRDRFPLLAGELGEMKREDIIKKYGTP